MNDKEPRVSPTPARALGALLLLVGGFITFLLAALFAVTSIMAGDGQFTGFVIALVLGLISWGLHRAGLRLWRKLDTSPASLMGMESKVEKVWLTRPARSLAVSWVALAFGAGAVLLGLSYAFVPWGIDYLNWREDRSNYGWALQNIALGVCSIWIGLRSLREPSLHDLRLLAATGGFWMAWFGFGWALQQFVSLGRLTMLIAVAAGVLTYTILYWLMRRREGEADDQNFFCLGRIAIWIGTVGFVDLLYRTRPLLGLQSGWIPLLVVPALACYIVLVTMAGEERRFYRNAMMHELVAALIGIAALIAGPDLIRIISEVWVSLQPLRAMNWVVSIICSSYLYYLLLKWLRATEIESQEEERELHSPIGKFGSSKISVDR